MINEIEKEFLQQSNEIEGVYDFVSLDQAILAWEYLRGQKKLDNIAVLNTHKILMKNQDLKRNEKGQFRKMPVYIAGRECPVKNKAGLTIPQLMKYWCIDVNKSLRLKSDDWLRHHVEFETLHPFADGNGRTGRMLMNWERLKAKLPILVIKASERQEYYKWFI